MRRKRNIKKRRMWKIYEEKRKSKRRRRKVRRRSRKIKSGGRIVEAK